jgi:hypothetical protein
VTLAYIYHLLPLACRTPSVIERDPRLVAAEGAKMVARVQCLRISERIRRRCSLSSPGDHLEPLIVMGV